MAMDLVRSLEQQRLPPRAVREAIRGFTADIEGGNDFIRAKWQNNTNPPIMNPGWDLTFGTQDEGQGNQFEDLGDLKSSTRSIIPSTDPGITEPVARNSLGKSREHSTSTPKGSSLTGGNKYHPKPILQLEWEEVKTKPVVRRARGGDIWKQISSHPSTADSAGSQAIP